MRYILTKRNKSTDAATHSEFVSWMRKKDIQRWKDNQDFMEGYAFRKSTFENINLRFENEDIFVEDLQKNNLLKIENSKGFLGLF